MCGNYIVQAGKHRALPNQRFLQFALMDFVHFCSKYEQDYRLKTDVKFDFLVLPTIEKIGDVSMHNVYLDTLYKYPAHKVSLHSAFFAYCVTENYSFRSYNWMLFP